MKSTKPKKILMERSVFLNGNLIEKKSGDLILEKKDFDDVFIESQDVDAYNYTSPMKKAIKHYYQVGFLLNLY